MMDAWKDVLNEFNRAVATGPVGPVSTGPLSNFRGTKSRVRGESTVDNIVSVNQRLMAARTSFKAQASLPSLPDAPHHLNDVAFPKRTFRKSKPVLCSA